MKVGIITFACAHNYGAYYQVFALQKTLELQGYEVDIINYRPSSIYNVYKLRKYKKNISKSQKIKTYTKQTAKLYLKEYWKIRKFNNFERAINNDLNTTKIFRNLKELKSENFDYDIIIAGSDQIWNYDLTKKVDPAYFIDFGPEKAIKIAYAPSLGKDKITDSAKDVFKKYLRNFDHLSIREETSKDAIKELTDNDIKVVSDPTFLLDKTVYDEHKIKSSYSKKEYIYVHFIGGVDENVIKSAEYVSNKLGVPVLHNSKKGIFENELDSRISIHPNEMLSVIENAEFIVSNSFHFTALPIIFEKKFITIPHSKRPGRMLNLLGNLDLKDRLIFDSSNISDDIFNDINYVKVAKKIQKSKDSSLEYLFSSINNGKKEKGNYFTNACKEDCYNCTLCRDICPKKCITMETDQDGFDYPKINQDDCIECKLCEKKCIKRNYLKNDPYKEEVYAIKHKDDDIRMKCSSGGFISELEKYIISQNGYIVGVKFDKDMIPVYDITNKIEDLESFRGSKYVEAKDNDIYSKVKKQLLNDKYVLFVGTPCKIAGLKTYLGKDFEKLLLIDIICHGVPSNKIFKSYIDDLEQRNNKKVSDFLFRVKSDGWRNYNVRVNFKDGSYKDEIGVKNNYLLMFRNNWILRPSCYNCEFTLSNKLADITIGDYWGIEKISPDFSDDIGVSILKVNSKKGKQYLEKLNDIFDIELSDIESAYLNNHRFPVNFTERRVDFMKSFEYDNVHEYMTINNRYKVVIKKSDLNRVKNNRDNSL